MGCGARAAIGHAASATHRTEKYSSPRIRPAGQDYIVSAQVSTLVEVKTGFATAI
jgi:hypothetical protein